MKQTTPLYVRPVSLDIIKDGGHWTYVIRDQVAPNYRGRWLAEVNSGLVGAEDIARAIVAAMNAETKSEG